jgi:hypothetical protein
VARNYSITGPGGASASFTTINQIHGSNLVLTKVYDIVVGSTANAPNDYAAVYNLQRYTVAGTVAAYTPLSLDPGGPAALAVGGTSATGVTGVTLEATYTATGVLVAIPLNMRATFRYVASPGAEFMNTLASGNGLGLRQVTVSTYFNATGTTLWFE